MTTEGNWRVQLFGAIRVTTPSGETVSFRGRKAGELLACVALRPEHGRTRSELIQLLWGDTDVTSVRTRLRQEIASLRAQFCSEGGSPSLLTITTDNVRLDPRVTTDVAQFMSCCLSASQQPDVKARVCHLREACSLYQAPLLNEFDTPWITHERLRFESMFEQANFALAEALLQTNETSEAEEALRRLLAHNPICEEAHIALMRLYAAHAQPDRVRQQYQELENALLAAGEMRPTDAAQELAARLREAAGRRATQSVVSAHSEAVATDSVQQIGRLPQPDRQSAPLSPLEPPPAVRMERRPVRSLARYPSLRLPLLILAIFLCSAGLWPWKRTHPDEGRTAITTSLPNTMPRWAFLYRPQSGEKADAEATAAVSTESHIYAAGFIKTQKDDVDILTVKLSRKGTQLWARRYSSPEHDCDRAFSICVGGSHSVYVGGETFVPAGHGVPEGWRLTLLRYDPEGHLRWARRSPVIVQDENHHIQVIGDTVGGCYLCGTALIGDKHRILILHYDRPGNLLWQKTLHEGISNWFGQIACTGDGILTLCGTVRRGEGPGGVNDEWLVVRLDDRGNVLWSREIDGPTHGSDNAARIVLDNSGIAYVAGTFDTGDPAHGGSGMNLAVVKIGQDGTRLWQRIAEGSGPNVALDGFSLNHLGDIAIGGTQRHPDGTMGIVVYRYDGLGFLTQSLPYLPPSGYRSAMLRVAAVDNNDNLLCMGLIGESTVNGMNDENSLFGMAADPTGKRCLHSIFNPVPKQPNRENGCIAAMDATLACFGQAGQQQGKRAFLVFQY